MTTDHLPHGGTLRDLRQDITNRANRASGTYVQKSLLLHSIPLDEDLRQLADMADGCSAYGWALAVILRWLEIYRPGTAATAGAMVQDILTAGVDSEHLALLEECGSDDH